MERELMEKFIEIMEEEKELKDVSMYYNIKRDWVISYRYKGQKYLLNIMEIN